jgi:hypothetical protein
VAAASDQASRAEARTFFVPHTARRHSNPVPGDIAQDGRTTERFLSPISVARCNKWETLIAAM